MRLIANAAFLWLVRIGTLTSSAIVTVLTARLLGPHGRGLYALPALDAGLAMTFAVGLSSALSYFVLKRHAMRGISGASLAGFLIFFTLGAAATAATAVLNHSTWAILPAIAMLFSYTIVTIACGYFIGRDRVRTAGALNGTAYLLTFAFVGVSLVVFKSSARFAIAAWVLAWAITAVAAASIALRDGRGRTGERTHVPTFLRFAAKAGALNLANFLNYRVDMFVVAIFLPVSVLGMYTIAVTGAESALSLTLALAQATLPRIGASSRTEAGLFVARCLRNGLFLAALLSIAAYVLAPSIVRLVLGAAYLPIIGPFRILIIGVVGASTSAVLSNYFMINLGRPIVPLSTSFLSAATCALLSYLLVPRIGMTGAAIASTVAYIGSQSVALVVFCRETRIHPKHVLFIDSGDIATYRKLLRRIVGRVKTPVHGTVGQTSP